MSVRIEHRIGVAAPASAVWAVVSDLDRWSEWTGLYTQASGRLGIGEPVRLRVEVEGEPPRDLTGVVVEWVPEAQLILQFKLLRGLLTLTRYIEVEALTERGCILANGEIQDGPALRLVPRRLQGAVRRAFERMNTQAKVRVEAGWDGVPDPPLIALAAAPPPQPAPRFKTPGR